MDNDGVRRRERNAAKATVGRIIPLSIVQNTELIIKRYQPLPLVWFPRFYWKHYNILFDASSMGFTDGIREYFAALDYMVEIDVSHGGSYMLSLRKEYINNKENSTHIDDSLTMKPEIFRKMVSTASNAFLITRNYNRVLRRLFDSSMDTLWHGELKQLLNINQNDIEIAKSPFEIINVHEPVKVRPVITRLRQILSAYPTGIAISQLGLLIPINKRLFNVTSINSFTVEYPEIFYIHESDKEHGESLVLDGRSNTYESLKDFCNEDLDQKEVIRSAFHTGIYQKTLLLIRKAEPEGLKLSVWNKSLRSSFGEARRGRERELINLDALQFFAALYNNSFVEIRSHPDCRNDLRIHLPTKPILFDSFV